MAAATPSTAAPGRCHRESGGIRLAAAAPPVVSASGGAAVRDGRENSPVGPCQREARDRTVRAGGASARPAVACADVPPGRETSASHALPRTFGTPLAAPARFRGNDTARRPDRCTQKVYLSLRAYLGSRPRVRGHSSASHASGPYLQYRGLNRSTRRPGCSVTPKLRRRTRSSTPPEGGHKFT